MTRSLDADWAITVLADALDEAIAPIDIDRNTPQENADHLYASLLSRGWTLVHIETMASHFRVRHETGGVSLAAIIHDEVCKTDFTTCVDLADRLTAAGVTRESDHAL